MVISPYAKKNYIDDNISNQASVVQFIEDNWGLGRISEDFGNGTVQDSFDKTAGSIEPMFDFQHPSGNTVILNDDGTVKSKTTIKVPPAGGFSSRLGVSVPGHGYGRAGKATVTVTTDGDPDGGTVTATIDNRRVGAPAVVNRRATIALPAGLAAGRHTLKLTYSGSADTKGATASTVFTVSKAATRTTVKAGKVAKNGRATVSVTVTAGSLKPTGRVTIKVNGKKVGSAAVKAGRATLSVKLGKASNRVVASYTASTNFAGSSSKPVTVKARVVKKARTRHRR